MKSFIFKGGVRIGAPIVNHGTSELYVDSGRIEIQTFIEDLIFYPEDIIDIIPHSGMINSGIRIIHKKFAYPEIIIFYSWIRRNIVIENIKETGFLQNVPKKFSENDIERLRNQNNLSYPLKINGLILSIFCLAFIHLSINSIETNFAKTNQTVIIILVLILIISFLTLANLSEGFRKIITKKDHNFKPIKTITLTILAIAIIFLIYIVIVLKT